MVIDKLITLGLVAAPIYTGAGGEKFTLTACLANAGIVTVGTETSQSTEFRAGDSKHFEGVTDISSIYAKSTVAGDKLALLVERTS